jgi:hypothetical protein
MSPMIRHRILAIAVGCVVILAALKWPIAAYAIGETQNEKLIVGPDNEIYGTEEAASLVAQARAFDPMYCSRDKANRDQAVVLYEEAIAAQPGAKLNAPLTNRIAQLYAFYEDKEKKIRPDRSKASMWWNQCLTATSSKQLLWAQAHMGLASAGVVGRDFMSALQHYNQILELDISQMELPDWQVWPAGDTERQRAALERERARLRDEVQGIQGAAADKQVYALKHVSRPAAYDALQKMAARFQGTPAGERASKLMAEIRENSRRGKDPWGLPANLAETQPAQADAQGPGKPEPERIRVANPSPSAVSPRRGWNYWGLGIAGLTILMAAMVAAGLVQRMRPKTSANLKGA